MNITSVKVTQMTSRKGTGREVSNQFEIRTADGVYFQSYNSIIAFIPNGTGDVLLDEYYWNYSRTTSAYRNKFLGESTDETKKKIADGVYKLVNLN